MKVTTECCVLGAWAHGLNPARILDIGAGTGVLSLMLAQRYDCIIDAVEIDEAAAKQAEDNFKMSPWNDRMNLYHEDINAFGVGAENKYDLIVSNPPFFNANLKSESKAKNLAIHDPSLSQDMLLKVIADLISDRGTAFVLFPEYEANQFLTLMEQFELKGRVSLIIRNKPNGDIFRKVVEISKSDWSESGCTQELSIRNEHNEFSSRYIALLKPYYLHL